MMLAKLTGPTYTFTTADAATITLPCLVITVLLADALPHGRLLQLTGSGHVTYAEQPGSVKRTFYSPPRGRPGSSREAPARSSLIVCCRGVEGVGCPGRGAASGR